jgi:HAD superfamily hydrolase (TIGR01509 family)
MNVDSNEEKYNQLIKLSSGDFDAFLYDCDGTLADNMQAHKQSYIRVAADAGVVMDGDIVDELAGWPIENVVEEVNCRYGSNFDPAAFAKKKHQIFFEEYIEQTQPITYVVNHLKSHFGKVKIAVVSGGNRNSVDKTLRVLGIRDLVEVLVCAGETHRGKPFPDPFLEAARQLNVAPGKCLVFEDGDPGIKAAEAAGMKWIRIDKI